MLLTPLFLEMFERRERKEKRPFPVPKINAAGREEPMAHTLRSPHAGPQFCPPLPLPRMPTGSQEDRAPQVAKLSL